jgi:hypothetical protein
LQPSAREKAAKQAIELFTEEWNKELEDKRAFGAALPGYREQLKTLVETTATEIADWMDPETREVVLRGIETTWAELKPDRFRRILRVHWRSLLGVNAILATPGMGSSISTEACPDADATICCGHSAEKRPSF